MSTQEIIISVDSTEVIDIEKIAQDNETIFTSFDDFVKEAIGLYINWWIHPKQSEKQFLDLLPHMHPKMIKSIEILMEDNEFSDAMIGVAEKRKKLPKLVFNSLSESGNPGIQRFPLTPRQLQLISTRRSLRDLA